MKHLSYHIILLLATLLLAQSCVREVLERQNTDSEEMVDVTISFGSSAGASVDVSTKSALGIVRESSVFNIYLLVFDSTSGKKIYGHYFDGNNLGASSQKNWWTVTNMSSATGDPTSGTIHISTAKKENCRIVAVANMNPNDLDVSAGQLSTINSYSELQGIVASQVRSEIAANSGFFLMTGEIDGVRIMGDSNADDITQKTFTLRLQRLYAKVTFNVRIAPGAPIRSFTPYKWQVVNVPTCSYLLERTSPIEDAATTDSQFFSTDAIGFEEESLTEDDDDTYADGGPKVSIHSFSFYMMENRKSPLSPLDNYADRERRDKEEKTYHDGYATCSNGDFKFADPHSAYVVMTGKIVMGYDATNGGQNSNANPNATLDANVTYVVHLGDFHSSVQDFNTKRNYNYVYNIFINGASDIKAEVDANNGSDSSFNENEPGASGRVVVAMEEIFDSDCHYSTQVISFHAAYMDPDKISWYVESPFNPDGIGPPPRQAIDMTKVDYKWVEFRVNEKGTDGKYSQKRVEYKPHDWDGFAQFPAGDKRRTMYIDELVKYLTQQKVQYDLDPSATDFDNDDQPKISVTAFVDEYYYTLHPLSEQYDPTLWKKIVNGPMRRMHILASSATSADGESDVIGSSFTIQQRAIQSIYAVQESADLTSAWGMEFIDDMQEETGEKKYWKNTSNEDCGNDSPTNGRLNSLKLWGILNPDGSTPATKHRWSEFLDLTSANETPQLLDNYKFLRYSCLSRNRDNNGDGFIDPEEIRWYMASDIQLIGVFMGSYGIEGDARLYQRSATDQASDEKDDWRQHIVASNRYAFNVLSERPSDYTNSNKYARVVWAEEGVNGSNISYKSTTEQTTNFSTRCVRNLGYYELGEERRDITLAVVDDPTIEPDDYVTTTRKHLNEDNTVTDNYTGDYDNRTFYEFDCSNINLASLRDPVDHELIGHDENSKMACLSSGFVTAPVINLVNTSNKSNHPFNGTNYNLTQITKLNEYLDASFPDLDASFSVCPEGYRLPNIRELSLIWTFLAPMTTGDATFLETENTSAPCRTHWSRGSLGSGKMPNKWGWAMSSKHLRMMDNNAAISKTPRCVKDI